GSGAVALSKERQACILHVDIGGGTTKLALIDKGVVVALQAFAVGGRLIAQDGEGAWTRFDDSVQEIARAEGWPRDAAALADEALRARYARRLAQVAADYVMGAPKDALGKALELTPPLPAYEKPAAITFSGGVAEYIFTYEEREYGDIAKPLAHELTRELAARGAPPLIDPGQRIRATVIGASQFTVQVSGKTIYLPDRAALPVHNIPVVRPKLDLSGAIDEAGMTQAILEAVSNMDMEPTQRLALALTWEGDPEYSRLAAAGRAIVAALAPGGRRDDLLVLMIDGDVGKTMGRLLREELGLPGALVSIDGVQLQELDFVDVGDLIDPPGVVPVVIKSLLFS
ncbi:MAG TPA: ethanolamine ammonia-lyase reactivating factor EutA, partial [Beijerinckiaceae bacterium]